jgi:serine/threonine protein kinase
LFIFNDSPALVSPFCQFGNAVQYLRKFPRANRLDIVSFHTVRLSVILLLSTDHWSRKGYGASPLPARHPRRSERGEASSAVEKTHLNNHLSSTTFLLTTSALRVSVIEQRGYTTDLVTTPRYMAPELLQYTKEQDTVAKNDLDERVTKESDVYAFGMVVLEVSFTFYNGRSWVIEVHPCYGLLHLLHHQRTHWLTCLFSAFNGEGTLVLVSTISGSRTSCGPRPPTPA